MNTKLFLLLQTDAYEDALALVESLGDSEQREFEKAYALYRLHREDEAAAHVSKLKGSPQPTDANQRGVTHLEAQLVGPICAIRLSRSLT